MEEEVVLFCCTEKIDEDDPHNIIGNATIEVIKHLESSLKEQDLEGKRAPFGWYKELEMKSKGHPLSNLSITVLPDSKQKSGIFCQTHSNHLEIQD